MQKQIIFTLAIAVVLVAAAAFMLYPQQPTGFAALPEKQTMKVGYVTVSSSLPVFIAEEKGFADAEGIDLELVMFANSNDMLNALVSGQLDATATINYATIAAAYIKEKNKFRIYSSAVETTDHHGTYLLVRPDSDITSINQMAGKKLLARTGASDKFSTKLLLKANGILPESVELIQVEPAMLLNAFAAGQGDMWWAFDPTATVAVEKGIAKILVAGPRPRYIMNPYPNAASLISTEFASKNPDAALAFKKATDAAIDYIKSNETEAKRILPKYLPVEENIAVKLSIDWPLKLEETDRGRVQQFVDLLWEEGLIDEKLGTSGMFWNPQS